MSVFNRNRAALGAIPQSADGWFYYLNGSTNGVDKNRATGGTALIQAAYITFSSHCYVKTALWDLRNALTYSLKIDTISYGSVSNAGQTADVPFTINEIFQQGAHYFEMTGSGAATWDDNNAAGYTGTHFTIPLNCYYNTTNYSLAIPCKLVYRPIVMGVY